MRELYTDIASPRKDVSWSSLCASHNAMWETNRLLLVPRVARVADGRNRRRHGAGRRSSRLLIAPLTNSACCSASERRHRLDRWDTLEGLQFSRMRCFIDANRARRRHGNARLRARRDGSRRDPRAADERAARARRRCSTGRRPRSSPRSRVPRPPARTAVSAPSSCSGATSSATGGACFSSPARQRPDFDCATRVPGHLSRDDDGARDARRERQRRSAAVAATLHVASPGDVRPGCDGPTSRAPSLAVGLVSCG